MAENRNPNPPPKPSPAPVNIVGVASLFKAYWIPLTLFSVFVFFQLVLLPSSFPSSHYDILRIRRGSSIEEVKEAYESLVAKWNSGAKLPTTSDFIKIRYSYELLSNPLWKRDYDLFSIDEHQPILENSLEQNSGEIYTRVSLPLLEVGSDTHESDINFMSFEDFQSVLGNQQSSLIQIYSNGSNQCKQFASKWKKIATLVGEVATAGLVDVGDFKLASQFVEKTPTGQLFFRNGLPSIIAIPDGCRSSNCFVRYEGELSVDSVTDWFATNVLKLPRIPYYTKESLGPRFHAKSSYHMVKVLFFSNTGMRATPFVRQVAKKYRDYASFACVLWREEEYSYWWSTYDVETAPATVILRDPGTKPLVYYGSVNSSWFVNVMEDNKLHELPQLRSVTSMELGCDPHGYSRAGLSSSIWYCVTVIGRPSPELNQMREVMRRVQQTLSDKSVQESTGIAELAAPSANALKSKRLTFTWMDGEVQKNLCMFYLGAEVSLGSCGPRSGIEDTPNVVMVRYMRNDSLNDAKDAKASNNILNYIKDDVDPVSQLVARYNGSTDSLEIIEWISNIIKDGDSANLPFYRTRTPELVSENSDYLWFMGSEKFISPSGGLKHKVKTIIAGCRDLSGDPRIGPMLLLAALMSFGSIWLRRNHSSHSHDSDQTQQTNSKREVPKEWRNRSRIGPSAEIPPSMTDFEPKNAYQMPLPDSDSE